MPSSGRIRKILLAGAGGFALLAGALLLAGRWRWAAATREVRSRLEASRLPLSPATFDPRQLEGLPEPVRHYLRRALRAGQPIVTSARVSTEGRFLMDAARGTWAPFEADQLFVTRRAGFDWDARIRMASAVPVFVRDAYADGDGRLRASVLGVLTVADQRGTRDLAEGELLRYLAEACWFPTALLPGQGVRWEAIDTTRARATLRDGTTTVWSEFRFGPDGLVASVYTPARPRTVGAANVPTPWQGRWTAWSMRNGMRVPSEGEVEWLLPEGPLVYWKGRIRKVSYEFAAGL